MYQFYSLPTWRQISIDFCQNEIPYLSDDLLSYLTTHEHLEDLKVMSAIGQRLADQLETLMPLKENQDTYYEEFLNLYDELVESGLDDLDQKPYCHSSCSNCCYQPIRSTFIEANFIIKNHTSNLNRDRIKKQSQCLSEKYESIKSWKDKLSRNEQACPLLDQKSGKCTVYEHRPLACRNYFALNTDKYCAEDPLTITEPSEQIKARLIRFLEPAILTSAISIIDHNGKNTKWIHDHLAEAD